MKTIIYFLSVLAVLLCASPGLLSQSREIGSIQNGKAVITNMANATSFFKAVYGSGTIVNDVNIQWSKAHNSYFLVGVTNEGRSTGLQLQTISNRLNAADGPKLEIFCRSDVNCHLCNLKDAVCECMDVNNDDGSCMTLSNNVTSVW